MVVLNSCVWWCWLESPGIAFPVRNIFANLWEDTKEYPGSCDIKIFKNMWWFWLTSNFWSWSWPVSLWPWANLSIIHFPSFWLQWEMQDDASCPCGRTSESYHSMIRLGNFHDSYWNPMIFNHWWYKSGKNIMGKSWENHEKIVFTGRRCSHFEVTRLRVAMAAFESPDGCGIEGVAPWTGRWWWCLESMGFPLDLLGKMLCVYGIF